MNIIYHNFPQSQFVNEMTAKRQIVIHHTVSGDGVNGDIHWWESTSERVATAYIIDRQGGIHQLFDPRCWAYHLGLTNAMFAKAGATYRPLDKQSIGIELDSWGALMPHTDGQFYPVKWDTGKKRMVANTAAKPVKYFYEYCTAGKWRGFTYFERYTTDQLKALQELLRDLTITFDIPRTYNPDMWEVSKRALTATPGIWAHASYRQDKSDAHPQPELVTILKNL